MTLRTDAPPRSTTEPPEAKPTSLIACLHEGASPELRRQVLGVLGLDAGPDPRYRWHRDDVLTVREVELQEDRIGQLEALDGVRRLYTPAGTSALFECFEEGLAEEVEIGPGIFLGRDHPGVIAGPCSVEGYNQVVETAQRVAEEGAVALRGGTFKPRTSPFAFGGLEEQGLQNLALARERTGLPVVTEVLHPDHLDLVAKYADVIQVGSRNMHNTSLLFQIGAHPSGRPVLLKRGLGATVDEVLHATDYILLGRLAAGHEAPGVILCERGIRTFERSTRFTLDIAAIPVLRKRCPAPVIADPSHAAGQRELVTPLAWAAMAAGADGLLVEVHVTPEAAWCDGPQSLTPEEFARLMEWPGRRAGDDGVGVSVA